MPLTDRLTRYRTARAAKKLWGKREFLVQKVVLHVDCCLHVSFGDNLIATFESKQKSKTLTVLSRMSSGLTKDQTDQFEQLFYSFDTDKDGGFLENNLR